MSLQPTPFDHSTLSSVELKYVYDKLQAKTAQLDSKFVLKNEQLMQFVQKISKKSFSREEFFKNLDEKLQQPSQPQPVDDNKMFVWFKDHSSSLRVTLDELNVRHSQNQFASQLSMALNSIQNVSSINSLSTEQLSHLRVVFASLRKIKQSQRATQKSSSGSLSVESPASTTIGVHDSSINEFYLTISELQNVFRERSKNLNSSTSSNFIPTIKGS